MQMVLWSTLDSCYRQPESRNVYITHGRRNHSTASRANSAEFCPSSLKSARPLGSSLEGAIFCKKKYMKNNQKGVLNLDPRDRTLFYKNEAQNMDSPLSKTDLCCF